jgi:two-component system phosphate regulon sensor histidine kinase PhoR
MARLRSDFVASVSHELRTPLAQIRWFAELLRLGRLRSPEERERSLRIIDQEARRLAFLVENVLNFSRSGSRTARLRLELVNLTSEVREIVDSFAPLVESRRVTIRTALESGVSALVDRAAFRQILLNLLDNAAKYGPPSQTVVVGVASAAGDRARLWVEDEGPGVPEAERVHVWRPFYRAERDRGSVATGSGIGLAVVGDLVTQQHGRRWIETGASGGARIVIEFQASADMLADADATSSADGHAPSDRQDHAPEPAGTAGRGAP